MVGYGGRRSDRLMDGGLGCLLGFRGVVRIVGTCTGISFGVRYAGAVERCLIVVFEILSDSEGGGDEGRSKGRSACCPDLHFVCGGVVRQRDNQWGKQLGIRPVLLMLNRILMCAIESPPN